MRNITLSPLRALTTLAMVTALTMVAGCASNGTTLSDGNDNRGEVVVTYTVLKLIEQSNTVTPDRVLSAVERVRTGVDGDELTTADGLTDLVLSQLNLEGLSPADRFLVQSVIGRVETDLVRDTAEGVLPEGYTERLEKWLGWIENAAYLAGAQR